MILINSEQMNSLTCLLECLRIPFRDFLNNLELAVAPLCPLPANAGAFIFLKDFLVEIFGHCSLFSMQLLNLQRMNPTCARGSSSGKRTRGNFHLPPPAIGWVPTTVSTSRTYQCFGEGHFLGCAKNIGGLPPVWSIGATASTSNLKVFGLKSESRFYTPDSGMSRETSILNDIGL